MTELSKLKWLCLEPLLTNRYGFLWFDGKRMNYLVTRKKLIFKGSTNTYYLGTHSFDYDDLHRNNHIT